MILKLLSPLQDASLVKHVTVPNVTHAVACGLFPQAPSGQVSNEKVKIIKKKTLSTRKILVIQRGKDRSQYSLAYLEYKSRRLQILKKQGKHKQIASHADVLKNVCVGG